MEKLEQRSDTCMGSDKWAGNEVPDHHNYHLGKWFDGIQNERIRSLPAFQELVQPREAVHASAKGALDAAVIHDLATMTATLEELDQSSSLVLQGMGELSEAIKY